MSMGEQLRYGMGWLPDYPDFRDYTDNDKEVKHLFAETGVLKTRKEKLPAKVDLREWCSPIENQGIIGSCTAHAGIGLVEYYERKACGKHIDASRMFLYKATRNLLHWTGDTGAFLRTTMAAMVLFGVPPEEYWRYDIEEFDEEPTAFCYAFAQQFQAIQYVRLDPPGTPAQELLQKTKTYLAAQLPVMFGFTVYSSIAQAKVDGKIPIPAPGEKVLGGHAVDAVGYDDNIEIVNAYSSDNKKIRTKGAILIRNSWGVAWGDGGYGWLPYDYLLKGLGTDWWTLIKGEWINTGNFGL
jgi:C1A family cysteine protease